MREKRLRCGYAASGDAVMRRFARLCGALRGYAASSMRLFGALRGYAASGDAVMRRVARLFGI